MISLYQLIENVYNTYMNYVSTVKYDVDIYNMYTYNELHWMYFELTPISDLQVSFSDQLASTTDRYYG